MTKPLRLSAKSAHILSLIAAGHSYAQIVDGNPDLTYRDIFAAAGEALRLDDVVARKQDGTIKSVKTSAPPAFVTNARREFARAYEPWSDQEDTQLAVLIAEGLGQAEVAVRLQRQPSAIESRLRRLGLL